MEIDQGQAGTLSDIRNNLPYIVAPIWEALARKHLLATSSRSQIPFPIQEVGSWWTLGAQIDVVGVNRADH